MPEIWHDVAVPHGTAVLPWHGVVVPHGTVVRRPPRLPDFLFKPLWAFVFGVSPALLWQLFGSF